MELFPQGELRNRGQRKAKVFELLSEGELTCEVMVGGILNEDFDRYRFGLICIKLKGVEDQTWTY